MGGLASDSDQVMAKEMQEYIQGHWHAVAKRTGATFNFDFWSNNQARRSTYPACRAVIAAGQQGDHKATMIQAIQEAYYLKAKNPSDTETLVQCAESIGINKEQFAQDMQSQTIEALFKHDLAQCQQWGIGGFPSLIFRRGDDVQMISNGFTELNHLVQRWDELSN